MYKRRLLRRGTQYSIFALDHYGRCPAEDFLKECKKDNIGAYKVFFRLFQRTADVGLIKNDTQFKHVRNNLYEFKVDNLRIFCFIQGGNILILTNASKKAGKSKKQTADIERAEKLRDEYIRTLSVNRFHILQGEKWKVKTGFKNSMKN